MAHRRRVAHVVHMNRPGITLCAALLLLLLAAPGAAWAQLPLLPPSDTAEDDVPAPQEPAPLPGAAEVATRWSQLADSAAADERTIERLGDTDGLTTAVEQAATHQADLRALIDATSVMEYVRPERISRLRDQVLLDDQNLASLRERTLQRLENLGALQASWGQRREFWERWREELEGRQDFDAVAADMQRAMARIDSVLARGTETLGRLVAVQRTIAELRGVNDQLSATLDAIRARSQAALLERSQPVLFSTAHRAQLTEGGWRAWRPTAALQPGLYGAFARDHAAMLLFHLLLAAALGALARKLRSTERGAGGWSGLLEHPWVLGIFASVFIAQQRVLLAPPPWDVLLWSIFAVSAIVLSRHIFAAHALRLTVRIFAVFYPLFILFEVMQLPAPVFRTALAAIAAVALPGFALLARRRTAVAAAEGVNDPRRIWPLRIGAAMWAVVLGALIPGYDALARWIVHATMTTGAIIFVVIVMLALIRGAVATLVVHDPGVRRHLAARVSVRLAQRLIFLVQVITVIAAALVLLDVWQLAGSPVDTWQRVTDAGFDAGSLRITVGNILVGAFVLYIAVLISWLVRNVVQSEVYGRLDFDRGVGESISKLLHYLFITIAVIVALAVLGVELQNFAIIAGALGIGIGFGLQNVVSNFASGLILLFERPVRVGDTVIVADEWGTITKIGLRSTIMLTLDQSEMIVPNTDLVSEKVVNWTLTNPTARVIMEVGVAYGTDVATVLGILSEAGLAHESTMAEPPPQALFMGFGDSSLDFELRVWVREIHKRLEVRSAILTEIQRRFTAAGIEIPFPQRDLHVRSVDSAAARSLAKPPESDT
jgi:potassium-dependent mechanosensitive channel